jgi:hypothetical protein
VADKPCPKCGKGCVACFNAGKSHPMALTRELRDAVSCVLGANDHELPEALRWLQDVQTAVEWQEKFGGESAR